MKYPAQYCMSQHAKYNHNSSRREIAYSTHKTMLSLCGFYLLDYKLFCNILLTLKTICWLVRKSGPVAKEKKSIFDFPSFQYCNCDKLTCEL